MKEKIIIAMSGGVDSSVAALLLQQQGYEVEGLFMKNWDYGIDGEQCPNKIEFEDAKAVGKILGIKVYGVNFVKEYKERVFDIFTKKLQQGQTPNPDILCNREIKFDVMLKEAQRLGASKIATGHYAKIEKIENKYILSKPTDNNKDQTYFLYALNQYQLEHAMFPLANLEKSQVRDIAKKANLPVFDKKDSTGICFIGERKFDEFITKYISAKRGDILNEYGDIIGEHKGLICYTLGQRKGIGLGGGLSDSHNPWYVAKKDVQTNSLTVVQDTNHKLLMSTIVSADEFHWSLDIPINIGDIVYAQIRYRQKHTPCVIKDIIDDEIIVEFDNPQRAVTIGQSLVLYKDNKCFGGGFIKSYK
jgi:tRNA-specific 2-thiouridylase